MVAISDRTPKSCGPWRRRRAERGAALFIVVLVITMLTGIGLFAIRSSVASTTSSGHVRQATQTHYLTEYGLTMVAAQLSTNERDAYIRLMNTERPDCLPNNPLCRCRSLGAAIVAALPNGVTNRTCKVLGLQELQSRMNAQSPPPPTNKVLEPYLAGVPGSLGPGGNDGSIDVQMTDFAPVAAPVVGAAAAGSQTTQLEYRSITLSVFGQVRPSALNPAALQQVAASVEAARAHVTIGPLPAF